MKNATSLTDNEDLNRLDEEGGFKKWSQHEGQDAEWEDGETYHQLAPAESAVREI